MPDFKDKIRIRFADLKLSLARENEIIEELSQHLKDQYEQLIARGATKDEAQSGSATGVERERFVGT